MNPPVEVILFDLGGVLVELGDHPLPPEWLADDQRFELSHWFASETAIAFEKGLIDAAAFAAGLQRDLNLEASCASIIKHFTRWPVGVFEGVHDSLRSLRDRYRLAILSNTNELHWPRISGEFDIVGHFEQVFASHQLHKAKPEPQMFEHVIDALQVAPARILFLDDNPENVVGSQQAGMRGVQVAGFAQARRLLSRMGLLDA